MPTGLSCLSEQSDGAGSTAGFGDPGLTPSSATSELHGLKQEMWFCFCQMGNIYFTSAVLQADLCAQGMVTGSVLYKCSDLPRGQGLEEIPMLAGIAAVLTVWEP